MACVTARHHTGLARAPTGWVVVSQTFPFVPAIVYIVCALPFAQWMLVGHVRAVPAEPAEAAAVDGAGRFRTLVPVTAPLLAPGIAATALYAFGAAWNEYFFALVLLKTPNRQILPVVRTHFTGAEGVAGLGPPAAVFLATLPSLAFALVQRWTAAGPLAGPDGAAAPPVRPGLSRVEGQGGHPALPGVLQRHDRPEPGREKHLDETYRLA